MPIQFDRPTREMQVPISDGSTITAQSMYNQIQTWMALSENMDEQIFMTASGKQALGSSKEVGITMQLSRTWLLGFEDRPGPAMIACLVDGGNFTALHTDTGTATSGGTTTLTDSSATFARHAAQSGDTIRNVTDGSTAEIVTVDSETVITHTALSGGVGNDWGVSDVWEIDSTHPFFPTPFVHVGFAQDAAPVSVSGELESDIALLRKIFLNKAITQEDTPGAGEKTITFYDDDQATPIDSIEISADGLTRTNP